MRHARDEDGFALGTAILLLMVIMGLGLGLMLLTDNQQKAAAREQASESAFNLAEAALNAQVGQLARTWPGTKTEAYPDTVNGVVRCTEATTSSTNGCPTSGSLSVAYPNTGSTACPAGANGDAWGSALNNKWTTYVRDNGGGTETLYNSAIDQGQPGWDANGDGKVWVRSVGVVQCRVVTLVSLASAQYFSTSFPHNAATGNWFETTNNGNKVLVNTLGKASQPGGMSMRCAGFGSKEACEKYREGQIAPNTTNVAETPSPTLSATQLAGLRATAKSQGTYYEAGNCPVGELTGRPMYVEGPCALGASGNSEGSPGFLIIANGTFSLGGNSTFYGVVYALNKQNSTGAVVSTHGNAHIIGAIAVDGSGGIEFGSSHENLEYNPTAINELKIYAGATETRSSFRVLPAGQ